MTVQPSIFIPKTTIMNFKEIWFLILFFAGNNCFSQDKSQADIVNITKLTFLDPGISYEKRIGKLQSLYFEAFMSISGSIGYSDALGNTSTFYLDPSLALQYRYYYNSEKRQSKGKRTDMNNLNYFSAIIETVFSKRRVSSNYFEERDHRTINTIGLVWGIQRNYKSRFSLDLNLGPGYYFTKATVGGTIHVSGFTTIGQLNFGFWLNKRK